MTRPTGRSRRIQALGLSVVLGAATLIAARQVGGVLAPDQVHPTAAAVAPPEVAQELTPQSSVPALVEGPDRPLDATLPELAAGTARTWTAHGRWWAVLPDPATGVHHIWTLEGPQGPWVDTGTLVDERPYARIDVAATEDELVVMATGTRDYRSHALRLTRFGWSASRERWVKEPDYPINATDVGAAGTRMAVTDSGEVWLARPLGTGVAVAHTEGRSPRVSDWAPVVAKGSDTDVGGYDLMADEASVRVVWRSITTDTLKVATLAEGSWSEATVPVPGAAGIGPIDIGASPGRPGALLALVPVLEPDKAGNNQVPELLLVAAEGPGLDPTVSVVGRVADQLRMPALLLDDETARVVAVAPSSAEEAEQAVARGGVPTTVIVEKEAALSDLVFPPGRGRTLIAGIDGGDPSRPLVPGNRADPADGRVLVASGREATKWVTWTDQAPDPTAAAAPLPGRVPTVLVNDTFEALAAGSPAPGSWYLDGPDAPAGAATVVDDAERGSRVLRIGDPAGPQPDPVNVCRAVPEVDGDSVTVEAVVQAVGQGTRDARLLTVRGPTGSLVSVRLSNEGLIGWSTPDGRVTPAALPEGGRMRVTVGLDLRLNTHDVVIRDQSGAVVAQARGLPSLASGPAPVDEICVRPAPGPGTAVRIDSLLVTIR